MAPRLCFHLDILKKSVLVDGFFKRGRESLSCVDWTWKIRSDSPVKWKNCVCLCDSYSAFVAGCVAGEIQSCFRWLKSVSLTDTVTSCRLHISSGPFVDHLFFFLNISIHQTEPSIKNTPCSTPLQSVCADGAFTRHIKFKHLLWLAVSKTRQSPCSVWIWRSRDATCSCIISADT